MTVALYVHLGKFLSFSQFFGRREVKNFQCDVKRRMSL